MNNEPLKVGDVVKLASGGPPMTIYYTIPDGTCYCTWFDNNSKLEGVFKEAMLKPVAKACQEP